jgi:anthranilate synthase
VGRYHSLYAVRDKLPACLEVTAETTEGGVIMGVRHRDLPVQAVQFHPESILTLTPGANHGLKLIENAVKFARVAMKSAR